jgi:hypothetical protein
MNQNLHTHQSCVICGLGRSDLKKIFSGESPKDGTSKSLFYTQINQKCTISKNPFITAVALSTFILFSNFLVVNWSHLAQLPTLLSRYSS